MDQGIKIRMFIILLLLLTGVSGMQAQNYTPFPDSNAVWKEAAETYPPGPWTWYDAHWDYILMGDTLINDMIYKKIGRIDYNVQCSELFTGPYYYTAIRDDTIARKVYQFTNDNDEYLLYDFSLVIGDTVNTVITYNYIVGSIDSILVGDTYRKRFIYTKDSWVDIEVIEGIGAFTGLLEPTEIFEHIHMLRCYYEDSTAVYVNPWVDQCDLEIDTCLPVNITELRPVKTSKAYPNPFTTSTAIEFTLDGNSKIQITIYNSIGESVYQFEDEFEQGTHTVTWSPGHLPSGLYYAVLRSEEGVSVVKMVKQ